MLYVLAAAAAAKEPWWGDSAFTLGGVLAGGVITFYLTWLMDSRTARRERKRQLEEEVVEISNQVLDAYTGAMALVPSNLPSLEEWLEVAAAATVSEPSKALLSALNRLEMIASAAITGSSRDLYLAWAKIFVPTTDEDEWFKSKLAADRALGSFTDEVRKWRELEPITDVESLASKVAGLLNENQQKLADQVKDSERREDRS